MCFLCFCFLLPPDFWVFVYFGDIRVLRDLTFSLGKKKKTHTHTHIWKRLGRGTVNTCTTFQILILKNGVGMWTLVQVGANITALHCNYLVLVLLRFWASTLTQYWSCAVSSSNFWAELCTNMHAPGSGWYRKNNGSFFLPTLNAHLLLTSFKGLRFVRTHSQR